MINPLLDMLESVAMIPGFSWVYKYAAKLRGAQTEVRDRKQRAEELTDRGKRAAGSAKNVAGKKKDAPKAGGGGSGGGGSGGRLRGASASNRKRAGVPAPRTTGTGDSGGGGRTSAPRAQEGFGEPSYTPPPKRERLRRRPRPGDDE